MTVTHRRTSFSLPTVETAVAIPPSAGAHVEFLPSPPCSPEPPFRTPRPSAFELQAIVDDEARIAHEIERRAQAVIIDENEVDPDDEDHSWTALYRSFGVSIPMPDFDPAEDRDVEDDSDE